MITPRRGEIYWTDFGTSIGSEMRDVHPAVILQNDVGNQVSNLTIVAVLTTRLRLARLPICVLVSKVETGLSKDSVVNLGHIYTVDKSRLRQRAGQLSSKAMHRVEEALLVSVGMRAYRFPSGT